MQIRHNWRWTYVLQFQRRIDSFSSYCNPLLRLKPLNVNRRLCDDWTHLIPHMRVKWDLLDLHFNHGFGELLSFEGLHLGCREFESLGIERPSGLGLFLFRNPADTERDTTYMRVLGPGLHIYLYGSDRRLMCCFLYNQRSIFSQKNY